MLLLMKEYGIKSMLVAYCIFNVAWLFVWQHFVKKEISLSFFMFISDSLPYFLLAATIMVITSIITGGVENIYLLLVSKIIIAGIF
jgi:hypothetical protein